MTESSDSPEVQTFMAAFQKLRNLVDDAPELIITEAKENRSLANLCVEVDKVADRLRGKERSRRELYTAPTNPAFLAAWRDYEARYIWPVGQVCRIMGYSPWIEFGPATDQDEDEFGPAPDEKSYEARWEASATDGRGTEQSFETQWNEIADKARSNANAVDIAISEAKIAIDTFPGENRDYKNSVRDGISAWSRLVDEAGFDLAAVFRRRELVPFVMVPRHVSNVYFATDSLSLMARLQQAQEAFVYGVPHAALALMRTILELLMRKHYGWDNGTLNDAIITANKKGVFPDTIRFPRVHTLLKLGNDALHSNPEKLHKVPDIEKEVLSLLYTLRVLIETAPKDDPVGG